MTGANGQHPARAREARSELLAVADAAPLVELAERCLDAGASVTVLSGPEVGVLALQVREPVERERFYLGEALVTQAEVDVDGTRGWAMRLGDDRVATLAAAVLDAVAAAGGPATAEIARLCDATAVARATADESEWADIAATEVRFEELD